MPSMIFVADDTVVNLDHIKKIKLCCVNEDPKATDPVRLDLTYTDGQLDQIDTTYDYAENALYMTQVCSGLIDEDEYTAAEKEIDDYCVNCTHFVEDPDDMCEHCVHNLDETLKPAGPEDNFTAEIATDGQD
ncbi:MAG: hypothetical protein HDQ88_08765 [Clostridia bacterium]|nr:hypothetical protein [Clostridia bacterium]